jgi:hypothetical protein
VGAFAFRFVSSWVCELTGVSSSQVKYQAEWSLGGHASYAYHLEFMALLLEAGADPNAADEVRFLDRVQEEYKVSEDNVRGPNSQWHRAKAVNISSNFGSFHVGRARATAQLHRGQNARPGLHRGYTSGAASARVVWC